MAKTSRGIGQRSIAKHRAISTFSSPLNPPSADLLGLQISTSADDPTFFIDRLRFGMGLTKLISPFFLSVRFSLKTLTSHDLLPTSPFATILCSTRKNNWWGKVVSRLIQNSFFTYKHYILGRKLLSRRRTKTLSCSAHEILFTCTVFLVLFCTL